MRLQSAWACGIKTFAIILAGVVASIALAVVAVFYFTAGMVGVVDEFFLAVKNENVESAYSYLSDDFKAGTSGAELVAFMEKNQLDDFDEANWQSRLYAVSAISVP